MKEYNKLVRDFIPAKIIENGSEPVFKRLLEEPEELILQLKLKLQEEVNEFFDATTFEHQVEELADITQVIEALMINLGIDEETLYNAKDDKAQKMGEFHDAIFLIGVK